MNLNAILVSYVLPTAVAYLIGSIPFSWILARLWAKIDLRQHGSGNVGATNVWRVLGTFPGLVAFAGDLAKGVAAVLWLKSSIISAAAVSLQPELAGTAVIAGHIWPVFLRFRGGKGVATGTGVFLILAPKALLVSFIVFVVVVACTRYVSLASMLGAVALPVAIRCLGHFTLTFCMAVVVAAVVIYSHRTNIQRLFTGQENQIKL